MFNMRSIVTALLWALFSPVLLTAQSASGAEKIITSPPSEQATSSQGPAASQPSFEDVRPSGPPIILGASLGTMLHLPSPVRTVFVANEDVADVQVKDPSSIYVTAKKTGATVLYASDNAGNVLLNKIVQVKDGPVAIIHGSKIDTGEPPPPSNFLVLSLVPAATQAPITAPR
jgi:Flp pilus assembly secretin CpaC